MTRAQLTSARLTLRPVAADNSSVSLAAMNELTVGGWLTPIAQPFFPAAQGHCSAKSAAQTVLSIQFSQDAYTLQTDAFADNAPSPHVLARLGFVQTRQGTNFCRALGEARAHLEFSLSERRSWCANPNNTPHP